MRTFALLALSAGLLPGQGTIYVGAYPKHVLVIDESQQKIVDRIELQTGTPRGLQMSLDRKTLYAATWDGNGIEVIDVPSRKVTSSFKVDHDNIRYRLGSMAADPAGKLIYTSVRPAEKKIDRFEIGKTKFAIIDLTEKKITKTFDLPAGEDPVFGGFGGFRLAPDGKFLYVFRDKIHIYNTADFKRVDTIELAKPDLPWMQNIGLGGPVDTSNDPNILVSLFNTSDPIVKRRIFGIARFDLTKRTFDFKPVGPSATGMSGLHLTPDHKTGYTVAFFGGGASRKTEFWVFDIASGQISRKADLDSRTRFSFGISSDGRKLYVYGAGFELDVYDARTLQKERTVDFNADMTTNLVVVPRN